MQAEFVGMPLARFLGVRILAAIGMLIAVSAVVFLITEVLPGDVATRILGRSPDPERLEILRDRLGLDQQLHTRYMQWLGNALTGDFGRSLISDQPVTDA